MERKNVKLIGYLRRLRIEELVPKLVMMENRKKNWKLRKLELKKRSVRDHSLLISKS